MSTNRVMNPYDYFPDFNQGRPIYNGQIFVGQVGLDPEVPANQKDVTFLDACDCPLNEVIMQPIRTSSGGVPTYNGSPIRMFVEGSYSLKVNDKNGNQVYYSPNVTNGIPLNPVTGMTSVMNSVELKKVTPESEGQQVSLLNLSSGPDSGGIFYWSGSNLLSSVLIDTNNAIFIAPDTDPTGASGAWVRKDRESLTLEKLGYIEGNADACINSAARLGISIIGENKEYIFSNTIYIPSQGISISSNTGEMSGFILQASPLMSVNEILIDTENYDYLVTNGVKVSSPTNPLSVSSPKTISILGVGISGNYTGGYLPSPIINEGIGARIYGGFIRSDLSVSNTINTGILTYYPLTDGGVVQGDNSDLVTQQSSISVKTQNTGREGFVFDGPADSILGVIVCQDASASNFALQDITPVDSVQYPDPIKLSPAIDIRKACHHIGFMNGFGTRNGWSTAISNNRFDSSGHVQVDSSDGGLFVAAGAWAQFASLEFHSMNYGFITHSGSLRPCILSDSVQGFICPSIKGELSGDWNSRPLIEINGVGANIDANITPRYSDAPTNVGNMVTVLGREHNVNLVSSGSLSGTNNKAFILSDLTQSKVTGLVHFIGNKAIADLTGLDPLIDKTNFISIAGITSTGNIVGTILGLDTLTPSDLKNTDIVVRSTTADKDYSTQSIGFSAPVPIAGGGTTTSVTHNYFETPAINSISYEFIPSAVSTFMPEITAVKINFISAFSVGIDYTMTGGFGDIIVKVTIN